MPFDSEAHAVDELLKPVDLGSFSLTPQTRSQSTFAGIPSIDKSKMWDFSLTEDGSGNRVLSFLVDNKTVNFRLNKDKDGSPIGATRLPDTDSADFGLGGESRKGRAQIHKANPSKIVGTFQTGKNNMTFEMSKSDDGEHSWTVASRKNPDANVATFVKAVLDKKGADQSNDKVDWGKLISEKLAPIKKHFDELAKPKPKVTPNPAKPLEDVLSKIRGFTTKQNGADTLLPEHGGLFNEIKDRILKTKIKLPSIDTLTYPLTGPTAGGLAASAGIGAGLWGIKNLIDRIRGVDHNSLLADMALGAGGGALASGGFRMMDAGARAAQGEPNPIAGGPKRKGPFMYSGNMMPGARIVNPKRPEGYKDYWQALKEYGRMVDRERAQQTNPYAKTGTEKKDEKTAQEKKVAFMTGNQTVDMIALQSLLSADPSLTQVERNALAGQARMAMNSHGGSTYVPINEIKSRGLGMLVGYIVSKMMGFGGFGTLASVALGGALGGGSSQSGPKWNSRGYYEY